MTHKTPRWLHLVAYLLDHRFPVTREMIFAHVAGYRGASESARRKFERDKDELRDLGVDIETVAIPSAAGDEPATGYRLRARSTYLPYFEVVEEEPAPHPYLGLDRIALSRDELDVLDRATRSLTGHAGTPLAGAAASARRKLAFDLPFESASVERILALPLPEHARKTLAVLQQAMIAGTAIGCDYFTRSRGVTEHRELEPWGLIFQWGRWYCVARSRDRNEPRLFRVDRMHAARRLEGPTAGFTVPADFDVRSFTGKSPWEFGSGEVVHASVRFAFPESRWVLNRRQGRLVREAPDHAAVFDFEVRDRDAFLRWLLSFGRRAELLQPATFAESLAALRADVAALYAEPVP